MIEAQPEVLAYHCTEAGLSERAALLWGTAGQRSLASTALALRWDEDAADAGKEHERCGSNLVAPLLASAAIGNVAVRRAGLRGPAAEGVVALGSVAFAVEVFAWSERHSGSRLARLLRLPGHEIQRTVGTREPSAEQLEVGHAALDEILRLERG